MTVIKEKGLFRLNNITSGDILALLENKHAKDVFVPECKNGETWGARDLLKLDAWVLKRTYSPLTIIGYEVKCSRQDFEQDQKWIQYLDLCHEFYFVCPAGLIRAIDIPARVGLIWASKDKLHTKRKAERVNPDTEKLNGLLIYVVMSRSKIVSNMYEINTEPQPSENRLRLLKEMVENAKEKSELAYFIKGHIRELYDGLETRELDVKFKIQQVEDFEERLTKLGIVWDANKMDWQEKMRVRDEIDLVRKRLDYNTLNKMKALGKALSEVAETIEKYRSEDVIK